MRRLAQFLIVAASAVWIAASSAGQTANLLINIGDFQQRSSDVSQVVVNPLYTNAAFNGMLLSEYFPPFTRANTTSLATGSLLLTNLVSGIPLVVTFTARGGDSTYVINVPWNTPNGATISAWTNVIGRVQGSFLPYLPIVPGSQPGFVPTAVDTSGHYVWTNPPAAGTNGSGGGGTGNVVGPPSSTDGTFALYLGGSGQVLTNRTASGTFGPGSFDPAGSSSTVQGALNAYIASINLASGNAAEVSTNRFVTSDQQAYGSNHVNGANIFGQVPAASLGSGSSISTKFLRGDLTWQAIVGGGDLLSGNNLSDVGNTATALANLNGVPITRTWTINGTSGQITSSAGSQNMSADRTVTLSLPTSLVIPGTVENVGTVSNRTHVSTTGTQTNFGPVFAQGPVTVAGPITNSAVAAKSILMTDANQKFVPVPTPSVASVVTNDASGNVGTYPLSLLATTNQLPVIVYAAPNAFPSFDGNTNITATNLWTMFWGSSNTLMISNIYGQVWQFKTNGPFVIPVASITADTNQVASLSNATALVLGNTTDLGVWVTAGQTNLMGVGGQSNPVVIVPGTGMTYTPTGPNAGKLDVTVTGGGTAFISTNIFITNTTARILDLALANTFRVFMETNATLVLSNTASLTSPAYIDYQQDTNGQRLLLSLTVAGGLLQTNANMQPTTNASAFDILQLLPGFFTTNVAAFWPQNFQPRVPFTNSLAGGGGGGGGGSPLITSGLVAYYKFDEGTGTTASDASGNSHNGTLSATSAGIIPTWVSGYIGAGALSFEGAHSYVDSGTDTALNPGTGDFSVVAWVKTSTTDTRVAVGKFSGSGDRFWLGNASGSVFFDVNNVNATGTATVADGNWHHLVGTRSGSTITVYVDGTSIATGSSGGACAPGGNMMVGMLGSNASFIWNGSIDEVAYYNRALTGTEVTTLKNQTHP